MRTLNPPTVPSPIGGYSQGVATSSFVFTAGQVGCDADGNVVGPGDAAEQTRQTLANIEAILREAGVDRTQVVMTTTYLTSFDQYRAYDEAYREFFGAHRPARATVRADLVLPELLVEIQAIAVKAET